MNEERAAALADSGARAEGERGFVGRARSRLGMAYRACGLGYLIVYAVRKALGSLSDQLERRLVAMEQRRGVVAPWTISASRFTALENKALWNTYDWSKLGEEWSRSPQWKREILERLFFPNVPEGAVAVEIGPGGGRWTEYLLKRCSQVHVVDVAERALELCRERFGSAPNLALHLSSGHDLAVSDASVDVVWSYDVFVHINALDTDGYLKEIARVLKGGGRAVIHHPGEPARGVKVRRGWRSDSTERLVLQSARGAGLAVESQSRDLVNAGDVLTVFRK